MSLRCVRTFDRIVKKKKSKDSCNFQFSLLKLFVSVRGGARAFAEKRRKKGGKKQHH